MVDAAEAAADLILARRARAVAARDDNRTTTAKKAILPYRTMPLPAAAGTMTTRRPLTAMRSGDASAC
jgi:hypothetical protein